MYHTVPHGNDAPAGLVAMQPFHEEGERGPISGQRTLPAGAWMMWIFPASMPPGVGHFPIVPRSPSSWNGCMATSPAGASLPWGTVWYMAARTSLSRYASTPACSVR
jgi:hypothetical protein